jgi:hypothetical protein
VNIRSGTGKEETDVGKEMRKIIAEFHVFFSLLLLFGAYVSTIWSTAPGKKKELASWGE